MTDEEYRQALVEGFHEAIFNISGEPILGTTKKALHIRAGPLLDAAIAIVAIYLSTDADLRTSAGLKHSSRQVAELYRKYVRAVQGDGGLSRHLKMPVVSYEDDGGTKQ